MLTLLLVWQPRLEPQPERGLVFLVAPKPPLGPEFLYELQPLQEPQLLQELLRPLAPLLMRLPLPVLQLPPRAVILLERLHEPHLLLVQRHLLGLASLMVPRPLQERQLLLPPRLMRPYRSKLATR